MDIQENIKVNKRIMKLIESKYPGSALELSEGLESKYYRKLRANITEAASALAQGGLAEIKR